MSNQSITNKLVANIRQASDVSKNFFSDTNRVVCIDTSNTRIGINTKTPQWSIDISGTGSYNGVKCHNLDISGKADISYALIKELRAPIISGDDVNISFIYVNELSGNLIDISEVVFNSISGDFIYSNNTISGNFIQCFSAQILNDLDIKGTLNVENFTFEKDVSFNEVNIDLSLTTQSASTSKFEGKVEFLNTIPVKYKELSGNHINTLSLSCENLQVNQIADFSSINVLGEASFNTIDVSGLATFTTISAETIIRNGDNLDNIIIQSTDSRYSYSNQDPKDVYFNRMKAKKMIVSVTNSYSIPNNNDDAINIIDSLKVLKNLEINKDGYLKLSELNKNPNSSLNTRLIDDKHRVYNGATLDDTDLSGVLGYGVDTNGVIDSLVLYKNNVNTNPVILKETSTKFLMFENSGNNLYTDNNYEFIGIKDKIYVGDDYNIRSHTTTTSNFGYINLPSVITSNKNIEINVNLSLKLINDSPGKDVDAANYTLYILSYYQQDTVLPTFNTLNKIKNSILVLDNSYNYANSSLNYIGKLNTSSSNNDISGIYFGLSFEHVSDLSFQVESFSGYIKTLV